MDGSIVSKSLGEKEAWRTCLKKYEVSSLGKVRRKGDKFPMKTRSPPKAYTKCSLVGTNGKKPYLVHRLVAFAFLGEPPDETYTVDHINRKPHDASLANLRWATKKQQSENRTKMKKRDKLRVLATSPESTKEYESVDEAANTLIGDLELKVKHITVYTCIVRSISTGKMYKGLKWKYISPTPSGITATIPSFPIYEASSCGMIRQLNGIWTKGFPKNGYLKVNIYNTDGQQKERFVHRLVAETFNNGKIPANNIVNHLSGVKTENQSFNLEWTNASGNVTHAIKTGLKTIPPGRSIGQYDITTGTLLKIHESICGAAREVSGSPPNLTACANGRQKTAYGFQWGWTDANGYTKSALGPVVKVTRPGRKINQYDLTGRLLKTHMSICGAASEVGGHQSNLLACANGRQKTAYGFTWGLVEDV